MALAVDAQVVIWKCVFVLGRRRTVWKCAFVRGRRRVFLCIQLRVTYASRLFGVFALGASLCAPRAARLSRADELSDARAWLLRG